MIRISTAAGLGLVILAAPQGAPAQDRPSDAARLQWMLECEDVSGESARLSCYDGAARRAWGMPIAARGAPAPVAAPPAPPRDFGREDTRRARAEKAGEIEAITARAACATDNGVGHWTITLDTGLRWQMTESSPHFQPPRAGAEVQIRRSARNGCLQRAGKQPAVRVRLLG